MAQPGLRLVDEGTGIDDLKQQLADCIRMLEKADIIDFNGIARSASARIAFSSIRAIASAAASRRPTSSPSTWKAAC